MTSSTLNLETLVLDSRSHSSREKGVCLLEAVAWYAGEDHSDMPACVSPVLRRYGIRLNDRLPDEHRQDLKQFIPRLVGTATDGLDERRRQIASHAVAELLTPWLRLAKLDDLAAEVEAGAGLTAPDLTALLRRVADRAWSVRYDLRVERRARIRQLLVARGLGGFIEVGSTGHGLRLVVLDRDAARRLHEATGLLLTEIDKQIGHFGGQQHLQAVPDA